MAEMPPAPQEAPGRELLLALRGASAVARGLKQSRCEVLQIASPSLPFVIRAR